MNEKIKLLWDKAVTLVEQEPDGDWSLDTIKDKFAELIVEECIAIVKPTQHHKVWAQSYLGGVNGLELLEDKCNKIKKHFGVEE